MKKIIAILLVLASLAALSACGLIRRVDDDPNAPKTTEKPVESDSYATDFSDTSESSIHASGEAAMTMANSVSGL